MMFRSYSMLPTFRFRFIDTSDGASPSERMYITISNAQHWGLRDARAPAAGR
jgi:hypothetical protein